MRKLLALAAALMAAVIVGTSVFAVTEFPLDEYELPLIPVDPEPAPTESSQDTVYDFTYITYDLEHIDLPVVPSTVLESFKLILAPKPGYVITSIEITYGFKTFTPIDNGDGTYTVDIDGLNGGEVKVSAKAEAVDDPPAVKPAISKKSLTLKAGAVRTLKVTNGKVKSWKSSNSKIVKVNKGKVTALSKGSATVTAVLTDNTKLKCRAVVTTSPKLSKSSLKIKKGKTAAVKLSGKAAAINNTYTNTKTAKITSKRSAAAIKVKALKKGKTTLKIKVNGVKTLKLNVTVK